nr:MULTISPECIES: MFS transporter [unclassified Rhodococcus (in: high G+C Gram-positive bacteria)]
MATGRNIDIAAVIDDAPISSLQRKAIGICLVLAVLDGFDATLMGFVIPALSEDWGVEPASFALTLTVSTGSMVLGSLLFGPVADRYGRRITTVLCTAIFAVFTLATVFAADMTTLMILRAFAGLGLGGVLPNLIALSSEYSPARARATVVTIVVAGMNLGAFVAGFVASAVIPAFGWRAMFVIGGVLPLVMAAAALRFLPESVRFLSLRGDNTRAAILLGAIDPSAGVTTEDRFVSTDTRVKKSPIGALFERGRLAETLVLWGVFVINFLVIYFLLSWMPSLFTQAGLGSSVSLVAASLFSLGGMTGALTIGWITDRIGNAFLTVMGGYALGAIFVIVTALVVGTGSAVLVFAAIFVVGFGMSGSSAGIIALAATVYPVEVRATGVGWAVGVGRIGSIIGPGIGGLLIASGLGAMSIFTVMVIPHTRRRDAARCACLSQSRMDRGCGYALAGAGLCRAGGNSKDLSFGPAIA